MSDTLPRVVENWPEVAGHAAARLCSGSLAQGGIAALDRVSGHLGRAADDQDVATVPVNATRLRRGGKRLALFATIAQFGTPQDATLNDLEIELYFPAEDASDTLLKSMFRIRPNLTR
jgi:hypothetical protein